MEYGIDQLLSQYIRVGARKNLQLMMGSGVSPTGVIGAVGRRWPTDGGPSQPTAYPLGRTGYFPDYM